VVDPSASSGRGCACRSPAEAEAQISVSLRCSPASSCSTNLGRGTSCGVTRGHGVWLSGKPWTPSALQPRESCLPSSPTAVDARFPPHLVHPRTAVVRAVQDGGHRSRGTVTPIRSAKRSNWQRQAVGSWSGGANQQAAQASGASDRVR